MSPDVLRRKLQKKVKRKKYRGKCPLCGARVKRTIEETCRLMERCGSWRADRCLYTKELFWTGEPG